MCGIAGCLVSPPDIVKPEWLASMASALRHRGPDDEGFLQWPGDGPATPTRHLATAPAQVGLVHERLAILDLSPAGWQPMVSHDGRYLLVFNGEIYNYVELREQLRAGHSFSSQGDTEVLLAALAEWGIDALPRLVGMFALALLDTQERTLTLARDFFGIKPLHYAQWPGGFAFASEIKALLELPAVGRRANPDAVANYLALGLVDQGADTLYQEVHSVPAGHALVVDVDEPHRRPRLVPFWAPDTSTRAELSIDQAAGTLRELFLDSVRLHLRSDVAVGTALSGGIDSSAIVSAVREVGGAGMEIHAFSYVADDPALSEEHWVDLVAGHVGARLHKVRPSAQELVRDLDHLIRVQDLPFGSTSIYAQHRVFGLAAAAGITVMLDGQGADEMMAGYRPYLTVRLAGLLRQRRLNEARRFAQQAAALPGSAPAGMLLAKAGMLLAPDVLRNAVLSRRRSPVAGWLSSAWLAEQGISNPQAPRAPVDLRLALETDVRAGSLPSLLRYEDRNSMAFSLESRVPFLTPQIVDFVLSLPESYLLDDQATTKSVFRRAMRGLVPDPVLDRTDKIGFATPEQAWLESIAPWVETVLAEADQAALPVIDLPAATRSWAAVREGKEPFGWHVWRGINLIRWAELNNVDLRP